MNEKIIGVTPRFSVEDNVIKQSSNDNYIKAIQGLGFTPIILPVGIKKNDIILELCDGFLITGGVDILPKFFGQIDQGTDKEANEDMDLTDKVIIEYAVKTKKPLLGICRGHQAINIFLGGTLIQDIGKSHSGGVKHTMFVKENRLFDWPDKLTVNSYHHQVIDKLAKNLTPFGFSEDGYVEAMVHDTLPIFSFQFHPERMMDEELGPIIFNKFKELVDENSI